MQRIEGLESLGPACSGGLDQCARRPAGWPSPIGLAIGRGAGADVRTTMGRGLAAWATCEGAYLTGRAA